MKPPTHRLTVELDVNLTDAEARDVYEYLRWLLPVEKVALFDVREVEELDHEEPIRIDVELARLERSGLIRTWCPATLNGERCWTVFPHVGQPAVYELDGIEDYLAAWRELEEAA